MSDSISAHNKVGYKKNLLQNSNKHSAHPLQNHPQLPLLIDVLSRKEKHHLILVMDFSEKIQLAFLEAFAYYLTTHTPPFALNKMDFFYLDIRQNLFAEKQYQDIDRYSQEILDTQQQDKCTLLAINQISWLDNKNLLTSSIYNKLLHQLLHEQQGRIIVITNQHDYQTFLKKHTLPASFVNLTIVSPSAIEAFGILKFFRDELADFHQVIIPEEILSHAYELAQRYLNHTHALDQALLLLDSSAARTSQVEKGKTTSESKPLVTAATLANVLSNWTGISSAQLQQKIFKLPEFTKEMQQRLFGQDTAIATIGLALQQAHIALQEKSGPYCSFLFAGPAHVGKKTTGYNFAELLFKQPHTCFYANLHASTTATALANIKVRSNKDHRYHVLADVIHATPYAIIFFDNVENASTETLYALEELFSSGSLINQDGQYVDFHQTIIVLATTVGTEHIVELTQSAQNIEQSDAIDLMQLVLSEQHYHKKSNHPLSSEDIITTLTPILNQRLPSSLLHYLTIVPFFPLDKTASEKIIRIKLRNLAKRLDSQFGIEFSYAPEVIRYLIQETITKEGQQRFSQSIEKTVEQRVYSLVGQLLLTKIDERHRFTQLFLQLNDNGQLLRCEWLNTATTRQPA
ncbi:MAG: hypothetical protein A3E83_05125 [Gammaproteobacteria bacterium RIFCSPHIGHO2_12_FULL_41_20]|nr:MAG: hypothetical protein A3E83_05125 [Gammaproteobacteria bacterium RIFCSPHIGHO2_12_FULL_41_20]